MIPTGNDTKAAKAYYDYLFSTYFHQMPVLRTDILWTGPFWIAFWAVILIVFFYLYSRYFSSVHRKKGELYGAASFAGAILERIGQVSILNWTIITFLTGVAIYFIVFHILEGFIY